MKCLHMVALTPLFLYLFIGLVHSSDNMTFIGTLIEPPPCTINDGNIIDVDFGDKIGVNSVNGIKHKQVINYQITCDSSTSPWLMMLTVYGSPVSFDNAAIITSKENLGIRLLADGIPFVLSQPIPINPQKPPLLEAVPVQTPGAILVEGAFVATATLQASYQ